MKTIRTYQNHGEAAFAQSLLESEGIEAVVQHEASATNLTISAIPVRLEVADEAMEAAEAILAAYPVKFTPVAADVPRIGFWRGGLYGLAIAAGILLLLMAGGGAFRVTWLGAVFVFIASALLGANVPAPATRPRADEE